ncbi:response regulator transcription factor [Streptomyces hirsutus]
MEHPVKVLVVTTFNLDEYVCEVLRAGAGGFPLKDAPSAQLLHGARTVVIGAALLDPQAARRLVGGYPARIRPAEDTAHDISPAHREGEVLRLIADGLSRTEIAAALLMGQETVKTFVPRVLAEPGFATVFRPSPTPTVEGW